MADTITLSRSGAIGAPDDNFPNTSEDARQLFLKKYAGEVLTAFDETNVAMERSLVREISEGKSAQFPTIAKADAWYHDAGERIDGQRIKHDERILNIDDLLISATNIYQLDEAMSHFDVRSEYSVQQGRALARTADRHLFQVGIQAARTSDDDSPSGFSGGGKVWIDDPSDTDRVVRGLFKAASVLDKKDVPPEDRYLFVPPELYYNLILHDRAISRDFNSGDPGSVSEGRIVSIAGFEIVRTNNLPVGEEIKESDNPRSGPKNDISDYSVDATNTIGLIWHRSAIGTVRLLDLKLESEYQVETQSNLMVAKYAMGHGWLRPDCVVELQAPEDSDILGDFEEPA